MRGQDLGLMEGNKQEGPRLTERQFFSVNCDFQHIGGWQLMHITLPTRTYHSPKSVRYEVFATILSERLPGGPASIVIKTARVYVSPGTQK